MLKQNAFSLNILFILTIGNGVNSNSVLSSQEIAIDTAEEITFKDKNFSNQNFHNHDFRNQTFENVDFTNADLRGALFDGAKFIKDVNLEGAILYCPLDDNNQPIMEEAFRVQSWYNHYDLVKQYSNLQKQAQKEQKKGDNKKSQILSEKAECLNSLFNLFELQLSNKAFCYFNLDNINLQRANLQMANLNTARLNGAKLQKANLEGATLEVACLKNANLEKANLKNTKLIDWNIEGTNLIEANMSQVCIGSKYKVKNYYTGLTANEVNNNIPEYNNDEELIEIYNSWRDTSTKEPFKKIMIAKNLPINDEPDITSSDIINNWFNKYF